MEREKAREERKKEGRGAFIIAEDIFTSRNYVIPRYV